MVFNGISWELMGLYGIYDMIQRISIGILTTKTMV